MDRESYVIEDDDDDEYYWNRREIEKVLIKEDAYRLGLSQASVDSLPFSPLLNIEKEQKQIDEQNVNGQNLKKRGNKPKRNYGKKRKKASDEQTRKPVNLKKMFSSMVPEK